MPPINPFPAVRSLAFRPRTLRPSSNAVIGVKRPAAWRSYADDKTPQHNTLPEAQAGEKGPNMDQAEHVSEEAAKMAKIQGGQGPDIEGQGTPVQDILREEKDLRSNAPKVMKDDLKSGNTPTPSGTRSFSTIASRRSPDLQSAADPSQLDPSMLPTKSQRDSYAADEQLQQAPLSLQQEKKGHKFPLPNLPLPPNSHKDHRYDEVVMQVTNLIMRDGKKATAQRNVNVILSTLRTAPAPIYSPSRKLLPGAPPASHLPLHPVLYLTLALDSVAPILRIRSQRGAAGGGVALQIPVPLGLRQRRRQALKWILDAVSKRRGRGSGRDMFAIKVAEELIAVVEGRSSVWERRDAVHRLGTTARSNLSYGTRRR